MSRAGRGGASSPVNGGGIVTLTPTGDFFRVFKTLLSLLSKRGYFIAESDLNINKEQFDQKFVRHGILSKDALSLDVAKVENPEERLLVKWTEGPKVGVHPIRTFFDELEKQKVSRGILVVETAISPFAKQAMNQFRPQLIMEAFSYAELKFDITTHKMVPRHRVLNSEQKRKLLANLGVRDTQLPRMQTTDPVARYYGLERGTVVEITRNSDTSGTYVTYRIVMPP